MHTIKNLFVLMAREVTTDSLDRMNSIIKIIDKFNISYSPKELEERDLQLGGDPIAFTARFAIATSWILEEKTKATLNLKLEANFSDSRNRDLGGPSFEVQIPTSHDRMNFNLLSETLPITGSGRYNLKVRLLSLEGDEIASGEYPFDVVLEEKP